jgi:hypothetical protein
MDTGKRKELFNTAYVVALAAQAGLNYESLVVDDDSVDITIVARNFVGGQIRNPKIDLQLKCTSKDYVKGGVIKYPLKRKNYDDLRGENVLTPRYLAVLVVPETPEEWLQHHDGHISLHNCCYWTSIRHAPDTTNTSKIVVEVPLAQRLTTNALLELMKLASNLESA